jgi:hypothetical protein
MRPSELAKLVKMVAAAWPKDGASGSELMGRGCAPVATVWVKEEATKQDLVDLGMTLGAWRAAEPRVVAIYGFRELLQGRYPEPVNQCTLEPVGELDLGPLGKETLYSMTTPWLYCPAVIWARERELSVEQAVEILRRVIPASLGRAGRGHEAFW